MGIPRAINVGGWENTRGPGCAGFVLPTLLSARKALLVSNLVVGPARWGRPASAWCGGRRPCLPMVRPGNGRQGRLPYAQRRGGLQPPIIEQLIVLRRLGNRRSVEPWPGTEACPTSRPEQPCRASERKTLEIHLADARAA